MKDLPPGWRWTTLGNISSTSLGKMLDKARATGEHPTPYLRNINVRWGGFDLSDVALMDIRPDELDRVLALPGDVIACEGGEPGRAAVWRGPEPIALQKALHRIRPGSAVLPEYIAYLLRSMAQGGALSPFVTGSTIRHLPQEKLRLVPVPLPPLPEQAAIIARVDEYLSYLDAAGRLLTRAARQVELLRTAVLRTRLSGQPCSTLASVCEIHAGVTPSGAPYSAEGIPFYKVGDMNSADGRWMAGSRTYLAPGSAAASKLRLWPAGTVIFPKQGGAIATNKKRQLRTPAFCDLNTMGVVPGPRMDAGFLYRALEGVDLSDLSDGTVVQQIKKPAVAGLHVPVPPLEEQQAIAEGIDADLDATERLASNVLSTVSKASTLKRAVLGAAFAGHLLDVADQLTDPGTSS